MTAKPESSVFKNLWLTWTPAFAGVTTFYECINCKLTTNCIDDIYKYFLLVRVQAIVEK